MLVWRNRWFHFLHVRAPFATLNTVPMARMLSGDTTVVLYTAPSATQCAVLAQERCLDDTLVVSYSAPVDNRVVTPMVTTSTMRLLCTCTAPVASVSTVPKATTWFR